MSAATKIAWLMRFTLCHLAPDARARETFGPARTLRKLQADVARPSIRRGRTLPAALPGGSRGGCNRDMHTEPQITQAPRLGRYRDRCQPLEGAVPHPAHVRARPVRGTFAIRSGSVDIAEPLADSAVRAEIDAASFRTGNQQRDQTVLSARFLDADRFPVISFRDGPGLRRRQDNPRDAHRARGLSGRSACRSAR